MSLLADSQILKLCREEAMISPFVETPQRTITTAQGEQKIPSYGVSSYGYDIRLAASDIKIFKNECDALFDPRKPDPRMFEQAEIRTDEDGLKYVILPGLTGMLGHTVEYFKIPRNILVTCLGKSTYARGIVSQILTPLEPEWEGELVLEIVNHAPTPTKIYLEVGIVQLIFMKGDVVCDISYKDKGGKYDQQKGTTLAKC